MITLPPDPDQELADLINKAKEHFQSDDFARFLEAEEKFDGPVRVHGVGLVQHYSLRKTLKNLPDYMQTAESAGLEYSQSVELLLHMLNSELFEFHSVEKTVDLMGRSFDTASKMGANIPDSYEAVMDMIKVGAEAGVINACFYSLSNLMRLGISVEEACKIVMRIPEIEGSVSGYPMPYFNDAVKSMLPAKVNSELVSEVFGFLGGERPWFRMGDYKTFTEVMTFGCPMYGITPNEMLTELATRIRNGGKEVLLLEDLGSEEKVSAFEERYFTEIAGELIHAAQPYKNKRSLNGGVRDLERLATANSSEWEEVGEGMWFFDPTEETWYSLGGKLEYPSMSQVLSRSVERVRHNFVSYDISEISDNPLLFHIHPAESSVFIAPPRESITHQQLRDPLTKYLSATPSRADYSVVAGFMKDAKSPIHPRAFIAHSLGVTEYKIPNDIGQIETMSQNSRAIRDTVFLDVDADGEYYSRKYSDHFSFVEELIRKQNKLLPEGFELILYPVNHNLL